MIYPLDGLLSLSQVTQQTNTGARRVVRPLLETTSVALALLYPDPPGGVGKKSLEGLTTATPHDQMLHQQPHNYSLMVFCHLHKGKRCRVKTLGFLWCSLGD